MFKLWFISVYVVAGVVTMTNQERVCHRQDITFDGVLEAVFWPVIISHAAYGKPICKSVFSEVAGND